MPLFKSLKILLCIAVVQMGSTAVGGEGGLAQPVTSESLVTAIYSKTLEKILIGTMTPMGYVSFQECRVDQPTPDRLMLANVRNCEILHHTSFAYDEGTIQRVNYAFQSVFAENYEAEKESPTNIRAPWKSVATVVAFDAALGYFAKVSLASGKPTALNRLSGPNRYAGTNAAILGAVMVLTTIPTLYAAYHNQKELELYHDSVPAFEDSMRHDFAELIESGKVAPFDTDSIPTSYYGNMYEVIRKSLIEAVEDAQTL